MENGADKKIEALKKIRQAPEIYAIISGCTNVPFVLCDEETYDDEILIFNQLEEAKEIAEELKSRKNPVQIAKISSQMLLGFFSMLYTMGVDSVLKDKGTGEEIRLKLADIVTRQPESELPEGKVRVENPQLHLTAIYFMQRLRAGAGQQETMSEELKELQEEMLAHFKEGRYIIAVSEDKGAPILKQKSGDTYQPVFTDMAEFMKFNKEKKFTTSVLGYEAITQMLPPEAKGVVVNPFGVNVQFQITKNKK